MRSTGFTESIIEYRARLPQGPWLRYYAQPSDWDRGAADRATELWGAVLADSPRRVLARPRELHHWEAPMDEVHREIGL